MPSPDTERMSDANRDESAHAGGRVVCFGEALVDFVCERPVDSLAEAGSFVPRQGGSLANIAVAAARFGARAELVGGAGGDEWGRWLRELIEAEGVGVERFRLPEAVGTSHAFVTVAADGEPSFAFYGDPERPAAYATGDVDDALAGEPGVLVVGSDTLLGDDEREATMRAVALASESGWQILCDPNLRPNRWTCRGEMVRVITALVRGASVVKLNADEALELTGRKDLQAAGESLRALGPGVVVVTRGAEGALVISEEGSQATGAVEAQLVDATGAGDSVAGVIAAGMAAGMPIGVTVRAAMGAAAGVVSAWGATAGLPGASDARLLDAG